MGDSVGHDHDEDGFRSGLARGELLVPVCRQCGAVLDYAQRVCGECGSAALGFRQAEGRGVLRSAVEMSVSYVDSLQAPYLVASVRLAEGPHLLARYAGTWDDVRGGQPVNALVEDGALCFKPA